jgi:hypothetical protein
MPRNLAREPEFQRKPKTNHDGVLICLSIGLNIFGYAALWRVGIWAVQYQHGFIYLCMGTGAAITLIGLVWWGVICLRARKEPSSD